VFKHTAFEHANASALSHVNTVDTTAISAFTNCRLATRALPPSPLLPLALTAAVNARQLDGGTRTALHASRDDATGGQNERENKTVSQVRVLACDHPTRCCSQNWVNIKLIKRTQKQFKFSRREGGVPRLTKRVAPRKWLQRWNTTNRAVTAVSMFRAVNVDARGIVAAIFRRMPHTIASENVEMTYDEADAEDFEVPSEDAPHGRPFFAGVDSQFVFLRALQSNHERLEAMFPSCPTHRQPAPRPLIGTCIALEDRQRLMTRSQMCAALTCKLVCFGGVCFMKQPLRHATIVLLRCCTYRLPIAAPTWSAWLEGHHHIVWSVALHPSSSLLATGSYDSTIKLWLLASDGSNGTCTATLKGHCDGVTSVAFHPSLPLLASGSYDSTVKLWLLSKDGSKGTCTATLKGHGDIVRSVAFHPRTHLLATGSDAGSVKLWVIKSGGSEVHCTATLQGHGSYIYSVAFHPRLSLLATGSHDSTVKLWLLAHDGSKGTCTATLKGHGSGVTSVLFHPSLPLLASGSNDKTAKVWLLNSDGTESTCTATLEGHTSCVWSLAFHPTLPLLASGSNDKTAKVWQLDSKFTEDKTCSATLEGHVDGITSLAFHSSLPLLVAGSRDCTVSLWR